jgi:hypothetical protein
MHRLNEDEQILWEKIQRILQSPKGEIQSYKIAKKSIDSRDKRNILFIYSVDVELHNQSIQLNKPNLIKHRAKFVEEFIYTINQIPFHTERKRPVVVGTWPAGLFAGIALARAWLNPIIIERWKAVNPDVGIFMKWWPLDEFNIQFWEEGQD